MDGEPLDDTGSTDAFSGGRTLPSTAQEPCPVCGRLFSKRYIATHADKCAAQTQKGQRKFSTSKCRRRRAFFAGNGHTFRGALAWMFLNFFFVKSIFF